MTPAQAQQHSAELIWAPPGGSEQPGWSLYLEGASIANTLTDLSPELAQQWAHAQLGEDLAWLPGHGRWYFVATHRVGGEGPVSPHCRDLQPASAAVVAGLAGEVETLRRTVDRLAGTPAQVQDLARVVGDLAEQVTAMAGPVEVTAPVSWLVLDQDARVVHQRLAELSGWLGEVYLRYADAAVSFPDCWLWHPDVVEELLCLMTSWRAAYRGPQASALAACDWHGRSRPGVVRRIKTLAGSCSLESHQPRPGPARPCAPVVPLAQACAPIAQWWALRRTSPAPEPTDAHIDAAAAAGRARRGERR